MRLRAVLIPYPEPEARFAKHYDAIFGVPVTFGAAVATLEFDNAILRAPIIQDEDTLAEYLRESPNLLLSERVYDVARAVPGRQLAASAADATTVAAPSVTVPSTGAVALC